MKFLLILTLMASPAIAATQPEVTLTASAVTVAGIHPGGFAALFGQASVPTGAVPRLVHIEQVAADDDADGTIVFGIEELPARSHWLAVDLTSGEFAASSPESGRETDWGLHPFPDAWIKKDNAGQLKRLEARLPLAELLWIRPGAGAWRTSIGDGGLRDRDGVQDGKSVLDSEDFTPLEQGGAPPPKNFRKGDILLAAEPWTLNLYAVQLKND